MNQQDENAVSPVVAVMLMLVVTIIIAAVVSGFTGGLVGSENQKVPTLMVDTRLANGGSWTNSYFMITVTGVENAIATKNLKIVTSWTKTLANGTVLKGGNTVIPGKYNYHMYYNGASPGWAATDDWWAVIPIGYGPGQLDANNTQTTTHHFIFNLYSQKACKGESTGTGKCSFSDINGIALGNTSWFGNYNLEVGTIMLARPLGGRTPNARLGKTGGAYEVGYGVAPNSTGTSWGGGLFKYAYGVSDFGSGSSAGYAAFWPTMGLKSHTEGEESEDMMMALLGQNWNYLRAGDTVNLKIIHTPSGKTIVNKDITVEG